MSKFFFIFLFLLPLYLFSASSDDKGLILIYKKGLANIYNQDIRLAVEILLKEMAKNTDILFETKYTDDLEKAIYDFQDLKVNILTMNFIYYLQEYEKISPYVQDAWTLLAKKNNNFRRFFLLVNKKSKIHSLKELKNKRIALLEKDSIQELYIDTLLLENEGVESNEFFREKVYQAKFSRALLKLFFNRIDACIVSEYVWDIAVELNPQIKNRLRIIDKSPDIFPPISVTLIRKESPEYSKMYKSFASDLRKNTRTTQFLNMYQVVESIKINESNIKPILEYYKHYLRLKKIKFKNAR
jgi:ABC-type phosphate/phosphonate transport system substrate-binding protein